MSERADGLARASFIALGFSIPISAAVDGLLTVLIALSWFAAARFRETAQAVRDNPVAAVACIWLAVHALGTLYSIGESSDVPRVVTKAAIFLLVPIAVITLRNPREREWALDALMCAIGLTAVLSTLRWLGVIPADVPFLKETSFSASVVFKYHLTQNLLVAFGAFLFAMRARQARTPRMRWAWAAAAGFAALNVLVMGDGRIGQVVLVVLLVYFAFGFGTARAITGAGVLIAAVGTAVYVVPDSTLHRRSSEAVSEALAWSSGVRAPKASSIGNRLDYYRTSAKHHCEASVSRRRNGRLPRGVRAGDRGNPTQAHAQSAQRVPPARGGARGCRRSSRVALFVVVWQQASRLATPADTAVARGLVITFAVASLASSPLADHTETLLFVWLAGVLFAGYRPASRDLARPLGQRGPSRRRAPAEG